MQTVRQALQTDRQRGSQEVNLYDPYRLTDSRSDKETDREIDIESQTDRERDTERGTQSDRQVEIHTVSHKDE